ncbi:hypothetical protein DMH17_17205 [Raoultella planticola]|nr:hypothetical protein [Raoultella planticola]
MTRGINGAARPDKIVELVVARFHGIILRHKGRRFVDNAQFTPITRERAGTDVEPRASASLSFPSLQ